MDMKDIKYTKDGKKVVVIGDLNQTEKIVQEIFVTEDGKEFPSGEKFVEKSLLDEPAKTWEQMQLDRLEKTYETESKEWEDKINELRDKKRIAYDALYERVKWLRNVAENSNEQEFKDAINRLADFLSNKNKWVVIKDCRRYLLKPFSDEGLNFLDRINRDYDFPRYDSMRLLSLYGSSDGKLSYQIDEYNYGGASDKPVMFFRNKKSALSFLQDKIDEKEEYTSYYIDMAHEYGLKLDKKKLDAYNNKNRQYIINNIKDLEKRLEDAKKDLENFVEVK